MDIGLSGEACVPKGRLPQKQGGEALEEVPSSPPEVHLNPTHRPLSSSFLRLAYRILNINHKKELLRGLWVKPLP